MASYKSENYPNQAASEALAIADLARREAHASQQIHTHPEVEPFVILASEDGDGRTSQKVVTLKRQEKPTRIITTANLHDVESFIAYVNRFSDPRTVLTANTLDMTKVAFTAALDYHRANDHDNGETPAPEWSTHKAVLALRPTPDWQAWLAADRKPMTLEAFAEFVESNSRSFVKPDAATMAELAEKFEASKSAQFAQGVKLANGDRQLEWKEVTTAVAGKIQIPTQLEVLVAPFIGSEPRPFTVFFRYSIREGKLSITLVLDRPDLAIKLDVDAIRQKIADDTELPVILGTL